jgi:hypothetical protein
LEGRKTVVWFLSQLSCLPLGRINGSGRGHWLRRIQLQIFMTGQQWSFVDEEPLHKTLIFIITKLPFLSTYFLSSSHFGNLTWVTQVEFRIHDLINIMQIRMRVHLLN